MLKIVNHIGTTSGSQEKHLKFPIDVNPRGPYKDHLVVRVDTGADVNCMNEKTFRRLFPKVKLSVCPYEIQNFGNSIADISILGQFRTYLQFRGEKYLNTFIVTNANDCPNLLSHGATFRMGVLLPNYPEENVVKGENVPNFKFGICWYIHRYIIKCVPDFTGFTTEAVQGDQFRFKQKYPELSQTSTTDTDLYNSTACTSNDLWIVPQPIRIQVWPHPLLVCLSHRLLPGPQYLLRPHPVQDNQPL